MIRIVNAKDFKRADISVQAQDVSSSVAGIIEAVRTHGNSAVIEYEKRFDGVEISSLEVSADQIQQALTTVGNDYIAVLERAAENIRAFHSRQLRNGFMFSPKEGVILGQRVLPLQRVGLYVPGGTASYPSSVLMNAIPAKIAGCEEIIIATPPEIRPEILAGAYVAGVSRVFMMGGAQAVAAMAYGTESVPKVDKIVGPGNVYVAEAKRQVFGKVAIDMIAGPSEIMIIADKNNVPAHIAADLLAQAEHDKLASAILLTTSKRLAKNVACELDLQLDTLLRKDIASEAIINNGAIVLVKNLDEAADIANDFAPEHLELCVEKPFEFMTKIRNAGSVFLGRHSPEALGDYYAGANHTLPTMGTARFSSPLSVEDFLKTSQYIYYSQDALNSATNDIDTFALSEGLTAHARSVTIRRE